MIAVVSRLQREGQERQAPTPLRVIGRGSLAGYAGLAAMGVLVKGVQALQGGDGGPPEDWSEAEPPAKFAHRFLDGVARRPVSVERAGLLNNVMHLLYAPPLGAWYGVFQESFRLPPLVHGTVFGSTVWALRITLNPLLELKEPFWRESPQRNMIDFGFHLTFGLAVAYAYRELERRVV